MNRTFLSLYLLIVLCIAAAGWGLDALWRHLSPPPTLTPAQQDLITLIEHQLHANPQALNTLNHTLTSQLDILNLDDFANSAYGQKINRGKPVLVYTQDGTLQIYKRLKGADSQQILRINMAQPKKNNQNYLYSLLLTVFYAAIGLAVFVWVWPLMRDVRRLEQHTQHVGKHRLPEPVNVLPGSAVNHLARAFNQMAERIKELLASHKEMTYAVSHELRTPLARMKFALAMIQNNQPDDTNTQGLRDDVDEMDALITQLLTYAGYEQEQGPLKQAEGDMAFLLRELITRAEQSHYKGTHQNADTTITTTLVCAPEHALVFCDWHLMERAVFNLIHNAFRFSQGRIEVVLTQDTTHFEITVSDDGIGVPEAERERVFESFIRLEAEANAQVRGFGLGLAIVKRVLKWHQGSASVAPSTELGGACFCLRWPK
ncbi:MAG: ATP-binding protein [Marinagarivorans sp.]|nr:ATP-binding protein [Marinagarivorans sp.]